MTNQNENNNQNDNQQNGSSDDNYDDVSRINLSKGHCFFQKFPKWYAYNPPFCLIQNR